MLFYEMIENLNCQGCRIRQPIDKKHWQTEVLYYVFWSILSQMRHVCCQNFPKTVVPKFVCSMVKISMPAILHRIFHLASQTMYFRVSYFFKILWQDTRNMLLWSHCKLFYSLKMFGIIWINKSMKKWPQTLTFRSNPLKDRLFKVF